MDVGLRSLFIYIKKKKNVQKSDLQFMDQSCEDHFSFPCHSISRTFNARPAVNYIILS